MALGEFYDYDGNAISYAEWGELFGRHDERHIAFRRVGDVEVSTVWMGLDYGFGHTPAPLIYETMVFGSDHHGEQWRTPNRAAALAAHDQAVALVREAELKR
jgi:hypothetical protein